MREIIGEYNSNLKKLYGSFRKRFGLNYEESLDYVDDMSCDYNYAIIYFASDISYSKELIQEINETGAGKAFGFYKDSSINFSVNEIKEAVPRIVGDGGNKFIFVELDEKSRFRLENIPLSVFIKLGKNYGNLVVDIVKAKEVVLGEVIRKIEKADQKEFNQLYNKLYVNRWECRKDIFLNNFKMSPSELFKLCDSNYDSGAFVCFKEDTMIGFVVYQFVIEKDNRAFNDLSTLIVRDIYVEEEFRRQGVASRLFKEVLRVADKAKAKKIRFKFWDFDQDTKKFVESLNSKALYYVHEIYI